MMRPRTIGFKDMTRHQKNAYEISLWRKRKERKRIQAQRRAQGILIKICTKCNVEKPLDDDHFIPSGHRADGFGHVCRECQGKAKKTLQERRVSRHHGLPAAERDAFIADKGKCDICGSKRHLYVDHCHETKTVRGVLCNLCNTGIGKLDDNPDLLERAVVYLRQSGAYRIGERREIKRQREVAAQWRALREALIRAA